MKFVLRRTHADNDSQFGELFCNDKFICFTLEDKIRDVKIKHETCIPEGTYRMIVNKSVRFKKNLPLLLSVPNFEGIRIHAGNTIADTSGCILVGSLIKGDRLLHSASMLTKVLTLIQTELKKGQVFIEIKNPVVEPVIEPVIEKIPEVQLPIVEKPTIIISQSNQFTKWIQWITHLFQNLLTRT